MSLILGLDTSNYTTSCACVDAETGEIRQIKRLLPVKENTVGLRQSDAVFHHTVQLPALLEELGCHAPAAVGVSVRPRSVEGSYMPCFLVGEGAARAIASAADVPLFRFSHQEGHIMAALYSSGKTDLLGREFLAFHVSGGTTEALLVSPEPENPLRCTCVGKTLDANAGQIIDRVGARLGCAFPAGPALERLALQSTARQHPTVHLKGCDCNLSGLQNQCERMIEKGEPAEDVARYCLTFIGRVLEKMTEAIFLEYGVLPVVFAGGVMSNSLIRRRLTDRFGASFAAPEFSSDNAAGIALLARRAFLREKGIE